MPGFRHPPGADIQRIRQDLRDRYQDGFPILKELLQNADDAGVAHPGEAATQCVFVLCDDGLPNAQHPLLRCPGLAVINDGGFTAEDANSLTSLGLSNKAVQTAAAGKFGLGLKSVFHLAEAFFYLSPHSFGGGHDTQSPGCDLLNPWSSRDMRTGRHSDWDKEWERTHLDDLRAFCMLVSVTGFERWFGLWIPLRSPEHTRDTQGPVQPIENRFPSPNLDELLGFDWRKRLAETLPLLRRVSAVRVYHHLDGAVQSVAEIHLVDGARRMIFGTETGLETQGSNRALSGKIEGSGHMAAVFFGGTECHTDTPALTGLRGHSAWPSQSTLGLDGSDIQVKEKAEPHGAVIFSRQKVNASATLRVHQAVFLPLGDPEPVACNGAWRYNLYLHGFFFVDSGRRHIQSDEGIKENFIPDQETNESELIRYWNRTLMHDVVAPLVIPSLEAFVKQEQIEVGEVEVLVKAMEKSETLSRIISCMCRGQRFILRLQHASSVWERQTWTEQSPRWIEMPAPDFPESELFNLLPALTTLCGNVTVSLKGKPCLASEDPVPPSDDELAILMGSVPVTAFDVPEQLKYLLDIIGSGTNNLEPDTPLVDAMVRLANQLLTKRLPEDNELANLWKEFFKQLPAKAIVRLPANSTEAVPEIALALAVSNPPVALLWQDSREAEGSGAMPWLSLLPLMQKLGTLVFNMPVLFQQRSKIAVRLIKACSSKPEGWLNDILDLPLFVAKEPSEQPCAIPFTRLHTAHNEQRVYTSGNEWAGDLVKAIPGIHLLLIDSNVAHVVGIPVFSCNATACIRLLKSAEHLAQDFSSRKPLFERLLKEARSDVADFWATLRCLLHGDINARETTATLFDETGAAPALLLLMKKALAASKQPWRGITPSVAGQLGLTAQQRQQLKLVPASEENVEKLVKDVGPSCLDCSDLSTEDCDFIIERLSDLEVLQGLNIHKTVDGRPANICRYTYIDDKQFAELPVEFDQLVTRLSPRNGYHRFNNMDGSNRLVNVLSWEAVVEIAVSENAPAKWSHTILTAIGRKGTLRSDLCARVRSVAWLPLANGAAARPDDLLHILDAEKELDGLPSTILNGRVPLLRLAEEVRNHDGYDTFKKTILPGIQEALDTLAMLLRNDATWSTGLSGEWAVEQVSNWVGAMEGASPEALPVATLVRVMNSREDARPLLPRFLQSISGQFSADTYAELLTRLASVHEIGDDDAKRKSETVFLRYLKAVDSVSVQFALEVLSKPRVKLRSSSGEWKPAGQMAPPTEGLDDADTLSRLWERAIPGVVAHSRQAGAPPSQRDFDGSTHTWSEMAVSVRQFFEPWRQHLPSPEPIGAFLSLFGSPREMVQLAEDYLRSDTVVNIHRWIEENYAGVLARLSCEFQNQTPHVEVQRSQTSRVYSLLGTPIETRRAANPTTLILGGDPCLEQKAAILVNNGLCPGPKRRIVRLLPVNPLDHPVADAVEMLQKAAEQVIAKTVGTKIDLGPLFQKLSQTGQVEVQVAQSFVVESALGLLRQIGGHSHGRIAEALNNWDAARREEATAELLGLHEQHRADERRRTAQKQIRALLERDSDTHTALLAKVREKIRQYRYDETSVAFELWQNADDAVAQLEQLTENISFAGELGFFVVASPTAIEFAHFGRLINECRLPGGPTCERLGFGHDLEKMVVQSISDKAQSAVDGGPSLTGKFGLGFKSVFVVTNTPEVLSGNVDFTIFGGIYPVRLNDGQRIALEGSLKVLAPDHWRRGTLIRLPLCADHTVNTGEVLGLFHRLAPLLVVFSRRLKRLRFRAPDNTETEVCWKPGTLATIEGVECGVVSALEDSLVQRALVLSRFANDDRMQILLGLDANGFVPLPNDVPVFWVTAPTRAIPGYGFALNGSFEPDVGRVQLDPNSKKNRILAGELAAALSNRLTKLHMNTAANWNALRSYLGLASETTVQDFWESLWQVLGRRFADKWRKDDGSPVAKLAGRILWESPADGLQAFYRICAALPTGLPGDYRTLTVLPELRFMACGAMDLESVFEAVSTWGVFRKRVPVGVICSQDKVVSTLTSLGVNLEAVEPVCLTEAASWELGERRLADTELATMLGRLITPDFMKRLREGNPGERNEQEHKTLTELLGNVQFQAADGSWHKATELVVVEGDGVEPDEQLRAAFAPQECRLHSGYTIFSLEFFLACRPRMEAGVEAMAEWVLQAGNEETRVAALRYLLSGELKYQLAESVRAQRNDQHWLWQLSGFTWFSRCFTDDEQFSVRADVLQLYRQEWRERDAVPQPPPLPPPPSPRHVWTVKEIWKWWENAQMPTGNYTLEGEANWDLFHGGSIPGETQRREGLKRLLRSPGEPEGKALWYRLFGYACLMSAGRHTTELQRFWRYRLNPKKFWERTSAGEFTQETQEIFEQAVTAAFTNNNAGGEAAYYWRRVFYDIRKIHRMIWANDFPSDLMRLVNEGHGQQLPNFLRTGKLPGPDQQRWVGTFGQSAGSPLFFVIRELVRLKVIEDKDETIRPLAFFVSTPVRRALRKIGWMDDTDYSTPDFEELSRLSQWLHREFTQDHEYGPRFLDVFDIPLLHMGVEYRGTSMPAPPQ